MSLAVSPAGAVPRAECPAGLHLVLRLLLRTLRTFHYPSTELRLEGVKVQYHRHVQRNRQMEANRCESGEY